MQNGTIASTDANEPVITTEPMDMWSIKLRSWGSHRDGYKEFYLVRYNAY
jgi:hypothetical protein